MMSRILHFAIHQRWLMVLLAFGGSYSERSIDLLRILALAGLPMTIERLYFTVLRIHGRLRELIVWRTLLTIVLLTACYLLIPAGGLNIIGWVWLVTHAAAAAAIIAFRSDLWLRD